MFPFTISPQLLHSLRWIPSFRVMNSQSKPRFHGYDAAIKTLLSLDKRPAVQNIPSSKTLNPQDKLKQMRELIELVEISKEELEELEVIHVAGTKGKGSTCALTESLIRTSSSSLKTGFYSSPHLVSTTERIRINGRPISQEKFSEHFWHLYSKIESLPHHIYFFKFLTLMALHVFIREKVDVVILEVGIGGTYDCTNIIDHPVACAITNLGLDHTSLLGNTIEEIAWHKSGICKPGVPVFVDSRQTPEAMSVIRKRALDIGSPCFVAPDFHDYDWGDSPPSLKLEGRVQLQNASLALQLAQYYLSQRGSTGFSSGKPFKPSPLHRKGLKSCSWPGRFQTVQLSSNLTLYFDAAHTKESMEECCNWYSKKSTSPDVQRVLLFNATKDHDSETMLKNLRKLSFNSVIFCTNVIIPSDDVLDNSYHPSVLQKMRDRCLNHKDFWVSLKESNPSQEHVLIIPYIAHALLWAINGESELLLQKYANEQIQTLESTNSPLRPLERKKCRMEILVTGSLHLVGDVMQALGIEP